MNIIVLMCNDFVIGVYSAADVALAASVEHWKTVEPRATELRLGQSVINGCVFMQWYYKQVAFDLDAEPRP